ncbi:MAG: FMN-binding protein [Thermaerobacter sp.]|nr:FMN-binding protein [Thermaerobacter sp.]
MAVTISRGKISAVKITSYNMHYPQSYVDPQMNQEFVKMQTYRVYAVSGATASSYNFAEAVYYALQRARA